MKHNTKQKTFFQKSCFDVLHLQGNICKREKGQSIGFIYPKGEDEKSFWNYIRNHSVLHVLATTKKTKLQSPPTLFDLSLYKLMSLNHCLTLQDILNQCKLKPSILQISSQIFTESKNETFYEYKWTFPKILVKENLQKIENVIFKNVYITSCKTKLPFSTMKIFIITETEHNTNLLHSKKQKNPRTSSDYHQKLRIISPTIIPKSEIRILISKGFDLLNTIATYKNNFKEKVFPDICLETELKVFKWSSSKHTQRMDFFTCVENIEHIGVKKRSYWSLKRFLNESFFHCVTDYNLICYNLKCIT